MKLQSSYLTKKVSFSTAEGKGGKKITTITIAYNINSRKNQSLKDREKDCAMKGLSSI